MSGRPIEHAMNKILKEAGEFPSLTPDPEVFGLSQKEEQRQIEGIELIASEVPSHLRN